MPPYPGPVPADITARLDGIQPEDERRQALERVRTLLLDLGCEPGEIDRAVEHDVLDLLVVDRLLVPPQGGMTQLDVAERTNVSLAETQRIWRALGFADVEEHEPAFTEMDVEAVQLFQAMVDMGSVDVDTAIHMARVIGSSMARIAEAETGPGGTPILLATGDSVIDADLFAQHAGVSLPAMARLLEYVWRRHLQAATRRAMLVRGRTHGEGSSPDLTVGFADMVGFTLLAQHLDDAELASVVARFEQLAHDTVVALGGRVVKMIGDEVMFVVESPDAGARIGLALAEAYADDEQLLDVRVALAAGSVLVQDGDYYGPVVNLASRLVAVANPGTVLVSGEFHDSLQEILAEREEPTEFEFRSVRSRTLKDLGRVQMWKLTRPGHAPGADGRRNMRWERLGEVLRELDDLRERGERLIVPGGRRGHDSDPAI